MEIAGDDGTWVHLTHRNGPWAAAATAYVPSDHPDEDVAAARAVITDAVDRQLRALSGEGL